MRILLALSLFLRAYSAPACEWKPNTVSYKISAELKEDSEQIVGRVFLKLKNNSCEKFDKLFFHVYPNAFRWEMDSTYSQEQRKSEEPEQHFLKYGRGSWMRIDAVKSRARNILPFSIEKELMRVDLPEPLAPQAEIDLEIPFITQLGNIAERSGVWKGNFAVSQWFPKLMVFDRSGWALPHNSGYHFVGEFYGDFGSYDVEITAPKKMLLGATGHKVREELLEDKQSKRHIFRADRVHDFAWVADRNFVERIIPLGKHKIHVLVRHPESLVIGDYAEAAFLYFSKRIGEYPYEDFTVAETYYNGPMEFPQLIFVRSWPFSLGRWFDRSATRVLEYSVTHETSHQWFYGTVGNNEVVDAWLDEGFATYLEESFNRDKYGKEENIFKFTNLLQLSDTQLSKIIWQLEESNLKQPIQTPSYLFETPNQYYASTYYKAWAMLRQWEAIQGRENFDKALQEYYRANRFRNASPEDWYRIVRKYGGEDSERWFRHWMDTVVHSDYAIHDLKTAKKPEGGFSHSFQVEQLGDHFAPVDIELTDDTGAKYRRQASFLPEQRTQHMRIDTPADVKNIEVDPEHVAPDNNRFNNTPGGMDKIKVWPITTRTVPSDALAFYPLPSLQKRSGIGYEAGIFIGVTHYLDWMGTFTFDKDLEHNMWDIDASFSTLDSDSRWGWEFDFQKDILEHKGALLAKKSTGQNFLPNASEQAKFGAVYFGKMTDGRAAKGIDTKYSFDAMGTGKRLRYSLALDSALARDFENRLNFGRFSSELHANLTLDHWIRLDMRAFGGYTSGKSPQSALFDLQAENEGAMRFDGKNVTAFKFPYVTAANIELQLPIPYGSFVDSLAVVHGPSWEVHLFCDLGNFALEERKFTDAGIGTRMYLLSEDFGKLGFNFEFVPYRELVDRRRLTSPVFLFEAILAR